MAYRLLSHTKPLHPGKIFLLTQHQPQFVMNISALIRKPQQAQPDTKDARLASTVNPKIDPAYFLHQIQDLPEVRAFITEEGNDGLTWQISSEGQLLAVWSDRIFEEVTLSRRSARKALGIYFAAKQITPALSLGHGKPEVLTFEVSEQAGETTISGQPWWGGLLNAG